MFVSHAVRLVDLVCARVETRELGGDAAAPGAEGVAGVDEKGVRGGGGEERAGVGDYTSKGPGRGWGFCGG